MPGRMIEFDSAGTAAPGYLATPVNHAGTAAPGVVVLHAWWGLTDPFRQVCDRLAEAGFVALAPDLYRGESTSLVAEAEALGAALDQRVERWRGDIAGAVRFLRQDGYLRQDRQHDSTSASSSAASDSVALLGFSLGGAYALDMSAILPDEIDAVVVFYDAYADPEYGAARAAYLCHFAADDAFLPAEKVADLGRALQAAGRPATFYTYPGTKHWFFEANRPDAYDAAAAALAWERTIAFLNATLSRR